nr:uncharacterized protein LOC113718190 [Coffea arabica]
MEGRRQRGRGRGRGPRQTQDQEEEQGSVANKNQGPRNEGGDQVATAINRMTDLLARLVDQQGQKCLRCGSSEHQIAACPVKLREGNEGVQPEKSNSKQPTASGSRPKASARAFALDYQRAPESYKVVEDTIPVFHRLAKLLIDPGATHSFVNPAFMYGIDINPVKLPYDLEVRTPTEDQNLIINMVYKNYEIWLEELGFFGAATVTPSGVRDEESSLVSRRTGHWRKRRRRM